MNKYFNIVLKVSILILLLSFSHSCNWNKEGSRQGDGENINTLDRILEKGVLSAITDYNSTTYFIYRGEPMGFHYELLNRFADHLGVRLEIGIGEDLEKTFACLAGSGCDVVAMDLTVTRDRSKIYDFAEPLYHGKQVLVQRKPKNWRRSKEEDKEDIYINNQLDLAGKTVYIQKNSSFFSRLMNLAQEIGDTIYVIEHPEYTAEKLVSMVASGEIDYTVCDEHIALVNRTYYNNIDAKIAVSFPQKLAWACPKGSDSLLVVLNSWLIDFKKKKQYTYLYNKYFKNPKSANIYESEFYSGKTGKISHYDEIIRKHSDVIGWDWRLIASLIYQESRFHPEVRSWAGAYGLMQLMPETAEQFGVDSLASPEDQIEAGIRFLKYIDKQLEEEISDPEERIKFILASYNVGIGHVLDARRLAEKYGKDSDKWFSHVDTFLLQKSEPKFYKDPVVYYGYCRGYEPVNFVAEILQRYDQYKTVFEE